MDIAAKRLGLTSLAEGHYLGPEVPDVQTLHRLVLCVPFFRHVMLNAHVYPCEKRKIHGMLFLLLRL